MASDATEKENTGANKKATVKAKANAESHNQGYGGRDRRLYSDD